jgi:spore coat protein U-like protein
VKLSKMFLTAASAAALVSVSGNAATGSKPTTFQVSAKVAANCTINATDMAFGSYDPVGANAVGGAPVGASSDIKVICTRGSSGVTVSLNAGNNASGTTRRLGNVGNTDFLTYTIVDDVGAGNPWTETSTTVGSVTTVSGGSVSYSNFTSLTSGVVHTAKGTLAAGQDVPVGNYADTVTATVWF